MKKGFIVILCLLVMLTLAYAATFSDVLQSDFNGTYNNTFYNSSGFIQMNNSIIGNTTTIITNGSEMIGNETGLVSYWRFNESSWNGVNGEVKDVLGKNNGIAKNTTTVNTSSGLLGNAGNFSGTAGTYANEVQIPNKEELNPLQNSFTITGWAKSIQKGGTNQWHLYAAKRTTSASNGYYVGMLEGSGLNFMVGDGATRKDTRDGTGGYVSISYNQWFHFAAVIDKTSNQILLYVNGTLRANQSISGVGNINNSGNLSIGNDEGQAIAGYNYPVKGQIDEVAIWNRTLSLSEILALYNQGLQNTTTITTNSTYFYNGTYESNVKDAGGIVIWKNISWNDMLTGLLGELPDNQQSDFGISMSGNVLLYHLNEQSGVILDTSGRSNNGTQSGGITYNSPGKFNSALSFDGADDYINIPNSNSLNLGNTLTISAWVYPLSLSNRPVIFSTRKTNPANSFQLEIGAGNSHSAVAAVTGINTWVAETNNNAVTLNTWNHIVYTRNGTGNTHKIYVNGQLQNLQTTTAYDFADNTDDKMIGTGTTLQAIHFFNGTIDEVAVFNRTLSAEEVLNLYNRNGSSSNLKFKIRTSNDNSSWTEYTGSDGTSNTYYNSLGILNISNSRYLQYKAYFLDSSAKLYNISITYDSSSSSDILVSLDSPADNYLTNEYNINIICSASSTSQLSNVTPYYSKFGWNPSEPAREISGTSNTTTFTLNEIASTIKWNCLACNINGNCSFASSNKTIIGDILAPAINLISPVNNYLENLSSTINFIFNATDNRATSLSCKLLVNNIEVATNSSVISGINTNITSTLSNGNHTWKINCSDGINSALSEERNITVSVSASYTPFWAKANTHTHTTNSDGDSSPTTVIGLYKNLGYSIVAITDHGYVTDCTPFTNLSANFLCVNSEEYTSTKHLTRINVSSAYSGTTQGAVNAANNEGGFAIVAHPNWSSTIWSVSDLTSLQNYTAMEIYNKVIERLSPDPYAVQKWDSVLLTGKKIFGVAADDMHQVNVDLGYGFTKVYMPEFTKAAYVSSMKTGYFYSSQGPNMDVGPFRLVCDGTDSYHMGETANCSAISVNATISATNSSYYIKNITLIKDGNILNITTCSTQNCSFSYSENVSSSGYYRLEATDSNNKRIWSNPIWVNKIALPVTITVYSPVNNSIISDYTPLINISLNQQTSLWYSLNNGANITLCSDCSSYTGYGYLIEGLNNLSFYANNSDNIIKENKVYVNLNFNKSISDDFRDNSSVASTLNVSWNNGKMSMIGGMFGNFIILPIKTLNNITSFYIEWTENNTENARGEGQRTPIILQYRIGNSSWEPYFEGGYIVNGTTVTGLNGNNLSLMFDFEKNPLVPIDLLDFKITWKEFTIPLIFNVSSGTPTTDSATITWDTDLASNSTVFYGISTSLGSSYNKVESVNSHSIILIGLNPGTNYFYKVQSCTESSCAQDPQTGMYSFTTQPLTPINPGNGGGGGGGGSFILPNQTGKLSVSLVGNIIARSGDNKKIPLTVKNIGTIFLNKCKLIASGEAGAWIYSNQVSGIAPGETLDFIFDLNVPEEINSGDYLGKLEIKCEEGNNIQEISVSIPSLKEVNIGEMIQEGRSLIINYTFDNSDFIGSSVIIDIWISDEAGNEIKRIQDQFEVNKEGLIERSVNLDVSGLSGLYYVNFALSSNLKEFVRQSIILGKSSSTGFAILDITRNKVILYVIFVLLVGIVVFFIWKRSDKTVKINKPDKSNKSNESDKSDKVDSSGPEWLLRKKASIAVFAFVFLIFLINISRNFTGFAVNNSNLINKNIFGAVIFCMLVFGMILFVLADKKEKLLNRVYSGNPILRSLLHKSVYTKDGEFLGKITNIIVGDCVIENIQISFNYKNKRKFHRKGILIKYKLISKIGDIVILKDFELIAKEPSK